MDCIVVHAVNLPPYQSIDWNYVSLISDKQWVTSFSCSVVVWEHCCPMNDVSIVMSPVNVRLLRIKYRTNMHQNSSFLDYMNVELYLWKHIASSRHDTNLMMIFFDFDVRK